MDPSQLYCLIVVSIAIIVLLKAFFNHFWFVDVQKKNEKIVRKRRSSPSNFSHFSSKKKINNSIDFHDVEQLRHFSLTELHQLNLKYSKSTDRYWREIFRRQNDSYHPDHLNVFCLQTANIITILEEILPQTSTMYSLTISGLARKPFNSKRSEVIRYLRDRLSTSQNNEIIFEDDKIRIVPKDSQD